MTRLSPSSATVHIADTGSCLLIRWETATPDLYQALRAGFEAAFPRHGEAAWRREAGAWAVPYRYHKRLNKWIARMFEAGALQWEQEQRRDATGEQEDERRRPRTTAVDLLAAYETLHLLPTAPPTLVTAAYRCLAQLQHPDRGGDDAAMARLNAAVACIRAHQAGTVQRS